MSLEQSEEPLAVLVEILSCSDLLIADKRTKASDSYVKAKLGTKDLHQTKCCLKTLNPTFGDAQHNSFVLDCSPKELFAHQGLLLKVKDYDRFGPDSDLGTILVPPMDICNSTGEPLVYTLAPPAGHAPNSNAGTITIRSMPATDAHLEKFGKKKKGLRGFMQGVQSDIKGKIQSNTPKAMASAFAPKRVHNPFSSSKDAAMIKSSETRDVPAPETGVADAALEKESNVKEAKSESEAAASTSQKQEEEEPSLKAEEDVLVPPDVEAMAASSENSKSKLKPLLIEELKLAIEIVGARGILIGDKTASDPYVKASYGDKEVHKTDHLSKTLNPIFKPEKSSTFILNCTNTELEENNGLLFTVKDWDFIGSNDVLGTVEVAAPALISCKGKTMEFIIIPPKGRESEDAGNLLIRCRRVTEEEEQEFKKKKQKQNLFETTTESATRAAWTSLPDPVLEQPEPKQSTIDVAVAVAADVDRSTRNNDQGTGGDAPESSMDAKVVDKMTQPEPGEELHLQIEIVSCRGLIIADKTSSDPYCKVSLGDKDLHRTKHILKTLNPVYSAETNNTFNLHCLASDLFDAEGLIFRMKDWDRFGSNDALGDVRVPARTLYANSNGKDMEFKLNPPKGHEGEEAGYIKIRCSPVSPDDHTDEKKGFFGIKAPTLRSPLGVFQPGSKKGLDATSNNSGGGQQDHSKEPTPLFVEIVSCQGLIAADKTGKSDPYIKIKFNKGKKDLHETSHVLQTLNPVFSSETNSSFVLDTNKKEVYDYDGLLFKIKDWDRVGKNDELGHCCLSPEAIYQATGEDMELKITPPKGHGEAAGYITIRIRPATEEDRVNKKSFLSGFKKAMAPAKDYGPTDLSLLVEIVSCWKLPIADLNSTDPYTKVKIGQRNVHTTKPISNTRDPIYTIKHKNLFILDVATKELMENGGIVFKVKDFDLIGRNDDLGSVTVPTETVLKAKGERLEYSLKEQGGKDAGFIALRFRPATNYDRQFLQTVSEEDSKRKAVDFMGIERSYEKTMKPFTGTGRLKAIMTKSTKEENGVKKVRVKPYADPESPSTTEWLAEEHIEKDAMKESTRWLDIGTGNLGRIFIEVIGADNLPNKDNDLPGGGNKTDPFVALVYEDCVCKTDVIDDCLSPRWMPWTQRAFIFRRMCVSSNLNVAVFDYDAGKLSNHDICGRVSIDLSNLQPDTEYLLRYNLYENSVKVDREPKGSITLRLRMESKTEKELILSNLQPPPEIYVNVKSPKDFDLVRETVGGRQDFESYSTKTIQMYVDELMALTFLKYYVFDALISLLFWRGQVPFLGLYIPIHSAILFISGITLAEYPSLYPAFFFFSIAWLLIATQMWRNSTPNPWAKSKSFVGFLSALVTGKAINFPPQEIEAHQNEEESKERDRLLKKRIEKAEKDAEEYQMEQMKLQQEHEEMLADVGDQTADTNISTRKEKISFDPLKFVLYPIQQYLAMVCTALRFAKNVLIWDEPYIAFFLTAACLVIGFVFMFVPWAFIIRWTSRIIAWFGLGPHMKLVDIYWYSTFEELTEEQRKQQIKDALTAQLETAKTYAANARVQRENAQKTKEIKKALYGRFITRVPVLRLERLADVPLHSSTAKPYKPSSDQRTRALPDRVGGQHLVGTMIPRIVEDEEVPTEATDTESKKNA